jgi:hypothetical protein
MGTPRAQLDASIDSSSPAYMRLRHCRREAPINSCSCDVFVLARILLHVLLTPITVHFATRDDRGIGACGGQCVRRSVRLYEEIIYQAHVMFVS